MSPLDSADLLAFFALRAVPPLEEVDAGTYRRSLRLTRGAGVVELTPADTHVDVRFDPGVRQGHVLALPAGTGGFGRER